MADHLTPEKRSWNMSRIKSRHTNPEIMVRSLLHNMGYRFRLHRKDLPGRPDIVLPKYKTVIFVHGCFWHRHEGCKDTTTPKSNTASWIKKFSKNMERDRNNQKKLRELGWSVLIVWQCELKSIDELKFKLHNKLNKKKQ